MSESSRRTFSRNSKPNKRSTKYTKAKTSNERRTTWTAPPKAQAK